MINSYNLVDSTYQFLDGGANLVDTFYLPDSYLFVPAAGASSGTLISEDNGKHTRFISNNELLAMGFATVGLFTTQFNTDKGSVGASNTNMMNATLSGTGTRLHTTDSLWRVENTDGGYNFSVSDTQAKITDGNNELGADSAGLFMQAVEGATVRLGDGDGSENNTNIIIDDINSSIDIESAGITRVGDVGAGVVLWIDGADKTFQFFSTGGGIRLPNMTGVQATALGAGLAGEMIYVTSTNGVFTSIGTWIYEAGAWGKITVV